MSALSSFRRRLMVGAYPKEQPNYLCFTALESGTFTLTIASYVTIISLSYVEYSTDEGASWVRTDNVNNTTVTITTPTIAEGGKVLWRGIGERTSQYNGANSSLCSIFSSTCNYKISGCVISLLLGKKAKEDSLNISTFTFARLFYGDSHVVDISDLILPKDTSSNCYQNMFAGCTGLTHLPNDLLPATVLATNCYDSMFMNCSNLLNSPKLPASTLANYCYNAMFRGCTKLADVSDLPALSLNNYAYQNMLRDTKVTYIKMLSTDISATNCLTNWVYNVPNVNTSVFVKNINASWTTTGNSGVPTNWTVIYYDPALDKYYLDQQRSQECDDHGNPI